MGSGCCPFKYDFLCFVWIDDSAICSHSRNFTSKGMQTRFLKQFVNFTFNFTDQGNNSIGCNVRALVFGVRFAKVISFNA